MPKEVNRSIYPRRIMDIIKQVRKQKQGIAKVGLAIVVGVSDPV